MGKRSYMVSDKVCARCKDIRAGLQEAFDKLKEDIAAAAQFAGKNKLADKKEQAQYYRDVICTDMAALRAPADALEMMVDKNMWPFPTYGDLRFEV